MNENVVKDTFAQAESFFATSSDVKRSVCAISTSLVQGSSTRTGRHLELGQLPRLDGRLDGKQ